MHFPSFYLKSHKSYIPIYVRFYQVYTSPHPHNTNHAAAPYVTSSLLGPNTFLRTLQSATTSPCSSVRVTDRVSHPHKTTGKIRIKYTGYYSFRALLLQQPHSPTAFQTVHKFQRLLHVSTPTFSHHRPTWHCTGAACTNRARRIGAETCCCYLKLMEGLESNCERLLVTVVSSIAVYCGLYTAVCILRSVYCGLYIAVCILRSVYCGLYIPAPMLSAIPSVSSFLVSTLVQFPSISVTFTHTKFVPFPSSRSAHSVQQSERDTNSYYCYRYLLLDLLSGPPQFVQCETGVQRSSTLPYRLFVLRHKLVKLQT